MILSKQGLEFIKSWEKFRAEPYNDGYGYMTVGYGHLIRKGETIKKLTEAQALDILHSDVANAVRTVNRSVRVVLRQPQFDALTSLCFNIGGTAFIESTLLRLLNGKDIDGAANQFAMWRMSDGKISPGLVRRRDAERRMFADGEYHNNE